MVVALSFTALSAAAYQIVKTNVPIVGDFALDNAKIELSIDPGSIKSTSLRITNRSDQTRTFEVTIEDMKGTDNPSEPVVLLAEEKGPYSLKDLIVPQISEFTLRPREQILLPVTVAIPADAEPGGRYGSVLISTRSSNPPGLGAQTVSRLAALFFVRVTGQASEQGALEKFALRDRWLSLYQNPLTFELLFRNSGNVHLNPLGKITITNMYGGNVGEIEVAP